MTVCGLVTIDLSSLTGFQQALLFIQMCIGNPVSKPKNFPFLVFMGIISYIDHYFVGHGHHSKVRVLIFREQY